jgi:hypothetical protein
MRLSLGINMMVSSQTCRETKGHSGSTRQTRQPQSKTVHASGRCGMLSRLLPAGDALPSREGWACSAGPPAALLDLGASTARAQLEHSVSTARPLTTPRSLSCM